MSRIFFVVLVLAIAVATQMYHVDARSFNDEVAEGKVERRGFKSSLLTTARGFGKRSYTPRVPDERLSVPIDVLAEEIIRDPKLLAVLFQILDLDDNGMVTPEEIAITQSKMMEPSY